MEKYLKLGCVILAAGNAKRFGSDKLSADFHGQSLFRRTLGRVPSSLFNSIFVITKNDVFSNDIKEFHFTEIRNQNPELGQSHSMHLGLSALADCDAALFLVADQPLLRRESIEHLLKLWQSQPEKIAALAHNGKRGNPCLFPARFFPELLEVTGDKGGSAVIKRHPDDLVLLEVSAEELQDVDTVEELNRLIN